MTPQGLSHAWLTAVGIGAGLLLSMLVLLSIAGRRLKQAKERLADLDEDRDRMLSHIQARLAAQREQAHADTLNGLDRIESLRKAISLYRQATQLRAPNDDLTFETLKQAIGLLEDHLRDEGIDPEA